MKYPRLRLCKPTWEDFIPEFDKKALSARLKSMPYHLATLLYPPNMVVGLELDSGKRGFISFYSQSFDEQRKDIEEMVRNVGGLSTNAATAVGKVKREFFAPPDKRALVYWNGVTWISQSNGLTPPWASAYGAHLLGLRPGMKVLVVGFGYGYASAVFYEAMKHQGDVFGIDISADTLKVGQKIFDQLGYEVHLRAKDGLKGWGNEIQFDAIWPSLTAKTLPSAWIRELKEGGRLAFFRAYTEEEYSYALQNFPEWSKDFPSYHEYQRKWWNEVCLSVYRKVGNELIEISRLYRLFNVPYVNAEFGVPKDREWELLLGSNESKLIEYFNQHIRPKKH